MLPFGNMRDLRLGFETKLFGVGFSDAVGRVTQALKHEGLGVVSEVDLRKVFKKKLGVEFRHYVILGACNLQLAREALESEPRLGLELLCNVVVQDAPEGGVLVSLARLDNAATRRISEEIERRLRRVVVSLEIQRAW